MDRSTKVDTVRFVRDELNELDYEEQGLLLSVYGFEEPWNDFSVQDSLIKGADDDLQSLASKLRGEKGLSEPDTVGQPAPLRVFASHLSASKLYVSQFRDQRQAYGIELFVAHSSIEVSKRWADDIEDYMRTCHAGIIFLEAESKDSEWCDQEVGWLLGRGIPIYTLMLDGAHLYGPLAERQAVPAQTEQFPGPFVKAAVTYFRTEASVAPNLTESLVKALVESFSWDNTRRVWEQIKHLRELTPEQVQRIDEAIPENHELKAASVFDAENRAETFPDAFARFKTLQAGFEAPDSSWTGSWSSNEPPF